MIGLGEACALGSAATWAVGVVMYRRLGEQLPPLALNAIKSVIVLTLLLPTAFLVHGANLGLSGIEIGLAVLSGLVGIALADTLYLRALNELGAGRMGIVGNAYSPFVILLGVVFLGERLGAIQILGFLLVSGGVLLVAKPPKEWRTHPTHTLRGVMIGLVSVMLMAVAIVMLKRTLEHAPLFWIATLRTAAALPALMLLSSARGEWKRTPALSALPWKRILIAATVGQFASMLLWLAGFAYTDASTAAVLNETTSAFIVLFAWWMLDERPGRRGLFGMTLTLLGVVLMLRG